MVWRQAITKTDADLVYWRISAALGGDEFYVHVLVMQT